MWPDAESEGGNAEGGGGELDGEIIIDASGGGAESDRKTLIYISGGGDPDILGCFSSDWADT